MSKETELNARLDHGVPLTVVDGIEVADTDAADATMAEAKARIEALEAERDEARRLSKLNNDLWHEACEISDERGQKWSTAEARCKRLEEALEVATFTPWLREWCKARFGKWITHNTAKGALADLRARLALQENINGG